MVVDLPGMDLHAEGAKIRAERAVILAERRGIRAVCRYLLADSGKTLPKRGGHNG